MAKAAPAHLRNSTTTSIVLQDDVLLYHNPRSSRFLKGSAIPKPSNVDSEGLIGLLWHPLNALLVFLPLGIFSFYRKWGDLVTFWLNFLALIPLAKILGDATEELAAGLKNDVLAGCLNASFGNAVEMVIMIQTLRANLFDVVKAYLMGSVLSNSLLVLGASFFLGGLFGHGRQQGQPVTNGTFDLLATEPDAGDMSREQTGSGLCEKVQYFPVLSALVNTSMLLLSCLAFSLVTVFRCISPVDDPESEYAAALLPISRTCSLIVGSSYIAYIVFQLITHKAALQENEGDDGYPLADKDGPTLSVSKAVVALAVVTVLVVISSELMVDCIESVCREAHMNMHFIGIILLPIVGNACEVVAAVRFAMKDRPGLSIGIAIGSSTQVSLFVVPSSVILGWCMQKDMDLDFGALNITVMTISVVVVLSMIVDGQSNWLQGYLLCAAYSVVAVLYYHLPNDLPETG